MKEKPRQKPKRKYERDTPVSLAPLDFKTALSALLKVDPRGTREDAEGSKNV